MYGLLFLRLVALCCVLLGGLCPTSVPLDYAATHSQALFLPCCDVVAAWLCDSSYVGQGAQYFLPAAMLLAILHAVRPIAVLLF